MSITEELVLGSQTTLIQSGLTSLGAGASAASVAAFDNTIGQTGNGYVLCDVELVLASNSAAYTANTGFSVWFCRSQDGTNYEDGFDASVIPARNPDVVLPVRAVTTAQRIVKSALMPPGKFYTLINNGAGQSTSATANGSTLKIRPITYQGN